MVTDDSQEENTSRPNSGDADIIGRYCADCAIEVLRLTSAELSRRCGGDSADSSSKKQSQLQHHQLQQHASADPGDAIKKLMRAATFAAGIVRLCATREENRRPLLIDSLQCTEAIAEMISVAVHCAEALRRRSLSTDMASVLTQLIAAVRFLFVNKTGASQLLKRKVCSGICLLLGKYYDHADLSFNCARVVAKMSLQEPFRAQINSNSMRNIQSLCAVLVHEARQCGRIMQTAESDEALQRDGDADNDDEGAAGGRQHSLSAVRWPTWQTWPVLSRVGYTLGNLTTSNDANRY